MRPLTKAAVSIGLIILILLIASWFFWLIKPSRSLDVIIVDKSVRDFRYTGHRSLTWVLNENKFRHGLNNKYRLSRDYYGFVPLRPRNSGNYMLRRYLLSDITDLVSQSDVIYFADMYGVYFNEWYKSQLPRDASSKIIGGINNNDYWLLKNLYDAKKTLIFENVFFADPTEPLVRYRTEELVNINPTGWNLKYFSNLDSANSQIPRWVIRLYKAANDGQWPFHNAGIIFVKSSGDAVVLEEGKHLSSAMPFLVTSQEKAGKYHVAESVPFTNWIEVVTAASKYHSISDFTLKTTTSGENVLSLHGIPSKFPAILNDSTGRIFYFTGDFANQKMSYATYLLSGYASLKSKSLFHRQGNAFLWNFYVPFMTELFDEVAKQKAASKTGRQ